jgi:hypothetical protein
MLENQGTLMSPNKKKIIWEIWGTLHFTYMDIYYSILIYFKF